MTLQDTISLPNKIEMPRISLGTKDLDSAGAEAAVADAIESGFRHIDTAQVYNNEIGVGRGIKASGLSRGCLFVTTKVDADIKTYTGAINSIERSLSRLDCGYIDLLLINAPMPWEHMLGPKRYFAENVEVWKAMEKFCTQGLVRAIGVSNFKKEDLANIMDSCHIQPSVIQIKMHPGKANVALMNKLQKIDITVQACSPLGSGKVLSNPLVMKLAEKYEASPAQICAKYALQKGVCPVIKATSKAHMQEYADLSFFNISQEDLNALTLIGAKRKKPYD